MLHGKFVSVDEAARAIGCTTGRVCQLLRAGIIDGIKLGARTWAVNFSSLEKFSEKPQGVGRPRISAK